MIIKIIVVIITRNIETIAKTICNASSLKCDDIRLKSEPPSRKLCTLRDSFSIEDAKHLILQCPHLDANRTGMLQRLRVIDLGASTNPC